MITLRAARSTAGYSVKEVARYLNISVGSVYRYERNAEELKIVTAVKLLDLYNIPLNRVRFRGISNVVP